MRCLIDGDILRYRIGFACETHYYDIYAKGDEDKGCLASLETAVLKNEWIEQYIGSKEDVTVKDRYVPDTIENCLHSVKMQVEFILNRVEATSFNIYLTGEGNYRDKLVDYYKANRKDSRKPYYYNEIGEYLTKIWKATVVDGMEADDALGIEQYNQIMSNTMDDFMEETIICTIDKDLDNIPGWHFNFVKDEKYWVHPTEAMCNFYCQLLTGDSTDNIPGLSKITGKRIQKWGPLLEPLPYCSTEKEMWNYVLNLYCTYMYSMNPEDCDPEDIKKAATIKLTEIGRLLYIKKQKDEPLWEPPNG